MKKVKAISAVIFVLAFFFSFALNPPLAQAEGEGIITATLKANPQTYRGSCPAVINFNGTITAKGLKPGTLIEYRFIRSDGALAPIQKIAFATGEGTVNVKTTWALGGPSLMVYNGWVAIRITKPVSNIESNKASFKISCEPSKPITTKPDLDPTKVKRFDPQPEPPGVSEIPQNIMK